MWASAIVKGQIAADASAGLGHCFVGMEVDFLVFDRTPSRSTNTLSRYAPLPSIEMAISAFFSTAVKSTEVNCDSWSVLNMSGLP